jgi:acyl-coenzyme A thioesterase PaaI-like protein
MTDTAQEHEAKPHALSRTLGLDRVIDHGESGRAVIRYVARMDHCHSGGIVQGGFVTGWIDAAMLAKGTSTVKLVPMRRPG